MKEIAFLTLILLYNASLVAGTAYLVFWMGHSGWWFALTLCFIASGKVD